MVAAGAAMGAASAESMTSQHQQTPFVIMTYVGPVVMSLGCFAVIFAFVVFCEARDHAIAYYVRSRLYSSSSRGPRHSRLPFRRNVIDHILKVTKRRAERRASRWSAPTAVVTNLGPITTEDAALIEPVSEMVNDDCQPVSVDVATISDLLPSNGMSQAASLSPRPLSDSIHVKEQQVVNRSSNGKSCDESACDSTSDTCRDQAEIDFVCLKRLDLSEHQSADLSLGSGILRQLSSERDGITSNKKRDYVADLIRNETAMQDVGWMEDSRCSEAARLMTADNLSDCDRAPENDELAITTMMCGQSQVASMKVNLSSSSLSSSQVMFSEAVVDDDIKITAPASNKDASDAVNSSPVPPATETVNHGPTADPDDRFSPTTTINNEDDSGKRQATPCRPPSTERETPSLSTAVGRAEVGWRRVDGDRDHHYTVMRSHAGIHCPPPLPPPPTSPAIVAASGRLPRRH